MKPHEIMDIGKVSKMSNLPVSTLRYYEEKGLIQSVGRNGLRRLFDANVVERLALISLGQIARFSLDEIAGMLSPSGSNIDRKLLSEKADELDQKIQQLSAVRDGLRHASVCKARSHLECPKFKRLLKLGNKGVFRKRKQFIEKQPK
ncbi:helix-turn-helix domain-containing protein [Puniceicoccaceae bacterium K14]|nr:helix-turn-helix domain-containing protein [Puniceicoccaceae bacterium K14]